MWGQTGSKAYHRGKATRMRRDDGSRGCSDSMSMPGACAASRYSPQKSGSSQKLTPYIISAAGTVTALLVLSSVLSRIMSLQTYDIGQAIIACGLAGFLAGAFSYTAIQLYNWLAKSDLSEVLAGDAVLSTRWICLAMLGVTIGAGVALFHQLAIAALPILPAYPFL